MDKEGNSGILNSVKAVNRILTHENNNQNEEESPNFINVNSLTETSQDQNLMFVTMKRKTHNLNQVLIAGNKLQLSPINWIESKGHSVLKLQNRVRE